MSQAGKRNADEAFQGQGDALQTKRRRRKGRKFTTILPAPEERTSSNSGAIESSRTLTSSAVLPMSRESRSEIETAQKQSPQLTKQPAKVANVRSDTAVKNNVDNPATAFKKKQSKTQALETTSKVLEVYTDVDGATEIIRKSDVDGKRQSRAVEKMTWSFSGRQGGAFINIDPIISEDNLYIILATRHDIKVYSASTSLLVRSMSVTDRGDIRTCAVSVANKQHILVGTKTGSLIHFDWTTGRKVSQCKLKSGVLCVSPVGIEGDCENLLVITSQGDGSYELIQLSVNIKTTERVTKSVLHTDYIHNYIGTSKDLSVIVIFGRDRIHVGHITQQEPTAFLAQQYSWNSVGTKGRIVACDARIAEQQNRSKTTYDVDIAVGIQNGAILVYSNIVNTLRTRSDADQSGSISSRRLHWHRTAARALKWSRDGNYLVSGGDESVLLIWQLDTNQKQFLPHLSTSILSIAISKSGAHYVLRLADNSVMVLSTADLSPSTNIVGLSTSAQSALQTTVMHPIEPNRLLAAVSIRAVGANATKEATHLQVYDVESSLQIGRQALTRNFVSAVNVAPHGSPLHEPDVTQLCITSDGKWLATVEEWSPNDTDLESLRLKEDQEWPSQESSLRIWSLDESDNTWNASVKVDNPHAGKASTVLAMAVNPARAEFATIGQDGCIKLWTPKARVRNGVIVKDRAGNSLYNWSCSVTSQIGSTDLEPMNRRSSSGTIAYSADGSVLAVHLRSETAGTYIHLIDSKSGTIVLSQPNLVNGSQVQLKFCGRYLIALSDTLNIYDTITLQVAFSLLLSSDYVDKQGKKNQQLAVNAMSNTIAVGVNFLDHKKPKAHISILDLGSPDLGSKTEITMSGYLQALLVDPAGKGFVILDTEAGIRKLMPQGTVSASNTELIPSTDSTMIEQGEQKGIDNIFGKNRDDGATTQESPVLLLNGPQTSSQSLDDLLRSNVGQARLGVSDLFERVAQAVSGIRIAA